MQPVAGVIPCQHVAQRPARSRRITFDEHVCLLVAIGQQASSGAIPFRPDQVSNGTKPACSPGSEKFINLVPAIKTDQKTARLEHPIDLGKSRLQPAAVVIAGQTPAGAIMEAY